MVDVSRRRVTIWLIAPLLVLAAARGTVQAQADCAVDPDRELLIRDLSVVEDCQRTTWGPCPIGTKVNAAWTFGRLMEGLAGTTDPATLSSFVLRWLSHWESPQVINGHVIPARPFIRQLVTDPWLQASGGRILDMKKAPFRLLAIVARLDLRTNVSVLTGNAGEARFVFGVFDLNNPQGAPPFTVIVEYGLRAASCEEQKKWAQLFHDLGAIPFGPTYNAALQGVTDRFTKIGSDPSRLNGSALNQLRTNEIALSAPWELREFTLQKDPASETPVSPLLETTVKLTPDNGFDQTRILADFINEHEDEILAQRHVVPEIYQGQNFLAGSSLNQIDFWGAPGINNNDARHLFSLNTCNGCHGRETQTIFLQIAPRTPGSRSTISGFLGGEDGNGIDVSDPVSGEIRHFDELDFRVKDLCRLLTQPCPVLEADPATTRVH